MARVTALRLRDSAREAMLLAGGRGFMRFLPEGEALLVTDAMRRCEDDAARGRLTAALEAAGFACRAQDGLLLLTPDDDVLCAAECGAPCEVDWESALHPAQALACRWLAEDRQRLTAAGRQLALDTLRLTWQPQDKVLAGLPALRAQAAVMLRCGDRSGLHPAGAILREWCDNA